jgi:hypothetical protein
MYTEGCKEAIKNEREMGRKEERKRQRYGLG